MNPDLLPGLLREVFRDIQEPTVLWQLAVVVSSLFVGWMVRHHYRRFLSKGSTVRWESLRSVATRVAMPATARRSKRLVYSTTAASPRPCGKTT